MSETYHVRISKDYLVFSAAHFITFDGDVCERLHGHNYRVAAEVYSPLDENHYVVDFIALRDVLTAIVDELDHRMLLPTDHPLIQVQADEHEVEVKFDPECQAGQKASSQSDAGSVSFTESKPRRWVFPRGDCLLLPIANTTTELLARYIGRRLIEDLSQRTGGSISRVRIEVDECFAMVGVCELDADGD